MSNSSASISSTPHLEQVYRRNFFLFLIDGILFTVALGTISSTTVIPDFVRHLTDSQILIGLSGSLFEIGWTLPQLFIARYIIRFERKKWWFAGPNIPVRFFVFALGILIMLFGREQHGLVLAAFFIFYGAAGVGDGLVGVPWADLAGTSLDNKWRARMLGLTTAIAYLILLLIVTPLIGVVLGNSGPGFPDNYGVLFAAAGVMFALSIIPPLFFIELPGGKAVEKTPALSEFLPELGRVLRTDAPFRSIMITRMLTTLFAMSGPFYIGFATGTLGLSSTVAVPNLLAMQTLGGIGGSLLYTWLGAKDNVLYIRVALAGGILLPISALLSSFVGPLPLYLGFLMSGLTLMSLGLGYQNWVITYASPEQRPIYAGLFNTMGALISFTAPFIAGTIAGALGYESLFIVSVVAGSGALYMALRHVHPPHVNKRGKLHEEANQPV